MEWHTVSRLSPHMEVTDEGYLVVRDVPIARTGTQIYYEHEVPPLQGDSGGRVHVARDASEVFKPISIQSFVGKPICDDHPMEPVGPANWHELAIGYVSSPRRGEGTNDDLLIADMIFTTQRGIDAVKRGKRAISVGYNAFYEQTAPGLGRQKDIHCNHVALVDEGRCGARCSIMDGKVVYSDDWRDDYKVQVETHAGTFHVRHHGEVERFREGYHNAELEPLQEFSRPEWLTDVDYIDTDDIDWHEQPRVPAGTSAGGQFGSVGAGGSEKSNEAQGAASEKRASIRERLQEKATELGRGFTEHDYHALQKHLPAGSEGRQSIGAHIRGIAKALPEMLKGHLKEEKQHAINAVHALRGAMQGTPPTPEQMKSLRTFATRILLSAGSMALTGDPTGTTGHLAAALAQEVVQHVVGEHVLQAVGGGARMAYSRIAASAPKDQAPEKQPADDELSPEDLALLQNFLEELAKAAERLEIGGDDKDEKPTEDKRAGWTDNVDFPFGDAEWQESDVKRDQIGRFAAHAQSHIDEMSNAEKGALETYTRGANFLTNKQRRHLTSTLENAETPSDAVLYHGTSGSRLRNMKVGGEYDNPRLTSTSLSRNVAHGYADIADPGLLELHAPKGTHGLYVQSLQQAGLKDEHEVLLGRHRYRVVSRGKDADGRTHVVAHVLGEDEPQIKRMRSVYSMPTAGSDEYEPVFNRAASERIEGGKKRTDHPLESVPKARLVSTQKGMNKSRVAQYMRHIPEDMEKPFGIEHKGRVYIDEGHHRIEAQLRKGADAVQMHVQHLKDMQTRDWLAWLGSWRTDAEYDPSKHPHAPAGAPAGKGGQFTKTGEGGGGAAPKRTWTRRADGRVRFEGNDKWGSSHTASQQIRTESAKLMGLKGWKQIETEAGDARIARKYLEAIKDSEGSEEALYSGFANDKGIEWTPGKRLHLPLVATAGSGDEDASGWGMRGKGGEPTVMEFPKGTKIAGYSNERSFWIKEYGGRAAYEKALQEGDLDPTIWSEALTAGEFEVVGTRKGFNSIYKTPYTVVTVKPVSYFDPDTGEWTKGVTEDAVLVEDAARFDPSEHPHAGKGAPAGTGGQFVKKGTGAGGTERAQERVGKAREAAGKARERAIRLKESAARAAASVKQAISSEAAPHKGAEKPVISKLTKMPAGERAYTGKPVATKVRLGTVSAGELGEAIITQYLKQEMGIRDAEPANPHVTNYPVDIKGDHMLIEAKTGQVSNSTGAQKWRATIGKPGIEETAWLAKAKPEVKAAWNQQKLQAIMDRKAAVLKEFKKQWGQAKGVTVTTIINPDTRTADIYRYDGFHLHIRWNNDAAKKAYVGSYKY